MLETVEEMKIGQFLTVVLLRRIQTLSFDELFLASPSVLLDPEHEASRICSLVLYHCLALLPICQ
jgi:hypothetical protein